MRKVIKQLKKAQTIALFSHSSPDPDTIGSTIALFLALKQMGKNVSLFCSGELPTNFAFIEEYSLYNKSFETYDLLVSVDTARSSMLGDFEERFLSHPNTARVDHHTGGEDYAKVNLVKHHSACAVLIFNLLKKAKAKITPKIATLLYFALAGDTGLFRNSGADAESFLIASKLIDFGADKNMIMKEYFDKKTVPFVQLTSSCLLNADINKKLGFVIMTASLDDYKKFGATVNENVGNLPNTYLACGFKIAVILKEKEDGISCSFRSAPDIDVSKIAEVFGGGGHKNAAGCLIEKTMAKAKADVKKAIKEYLSQGGNINAN